MDVLKEKPSFKILRLTFSSKLDWGSYIASIAKTACKKIGALILSMKFLSPENALYLYKSTIRPCIEYCCHVWAGAPSCYLDLLDKPPKRVCRTVGFSLASSLEPLAHCRNIASLSLFYRYYFGRCLSDLAQLVLLPDSGGRCTRYSDRLHDFECGSHSPALLDLFISSDTSMCSTMAFPPLGNFDHVVVSISINFPIDSK